MIFGDGNFKAQNTSKTIGVLLSAILSFSSPLLFADLSAAKWQELCGNGFAAVAGEIRPREFEPNGVVISKQRYERLPQRRSGEVNRMPEVEIVRTEPKAAPVIMERRELADQIPRLETTPAEIPQITRAEPEFAKIQRSRAPIEIPIEVSVAKDEPVAELRPRFQRLDRTRAEIPERMIERQIVEVREPENTEPSLENSVATINRMEMVEPKPELMKDSTVVIIQRRPAPIVIVEEAVVLVPEARPQVGLNKFERLKRKPSPPVEVVPIERTPTEIPIEVISPDLNLVRIEPTQVEVVGPEILSESNLPVSPKENERNEAEVSEREVTVSQSQGEKPKVETKIEAKESETGTTPKREVVSNERSQEPRSIVMPMRSAGEFIGSVSNPIRVGPLTTVGRRGTGEPGVKSDRGIEFKSNASGKTEVESVVGKNRVGSQGRVPEELPGGSSKPEITKVGDGETLTSRQPAPSSQVIDETPSTSNALANFSPRIDVTYPSRTFVPPRLNFPLASNPSFPISRIGGSGPSKNTKSSPAATGLTNFGGSSPIGAGVISVAKSEAEPGLKIGPQNRIVSGKAAQKSPTAKSESVGEELANQVRRDAFEPGAGLSLLNSSPIVEPGQVAQPKIASTNLSSPRVGAQTQSKKAVQKTPTPPKNTKPNLTTPVAQLNSQSATSNSNSNAVKVLPRIVPVSPFANSVTSPSQSVPQVASNPAKGTVPGTETLVPAKRGSGLRKGEAIVAALTNAGLLATPRRPRFINDGNRMGTDGAETAGRNVTSSAVPEILPGAGTVAFYDRMGNPTKRVQRSFRLQPNRVDIVTETLFDPVTKLATTRTVVETEYLESSGQVRESTTVMTLDPLSGKSIEVSKSTVVKNQKGEVLSSNVEVTRFDPKQGAVVRKTRAHGSNLAPLLASP